MQTHEASPPKRSRRTKAQIAALDDALCDIVQRIHPSTVRGVFYQAEVAQLVPKDEARGVQVVERRLIAMRDADPPVFPIDWIVDGVRRVRRPYSVLDFNDAMRDTAEQYRRHVWSNQPVLPIIVLEKVALAGVFEPITEEWDVPLVPLQGFGSISLAWQVAKIAEAAGKPVAAHHFGDWCPSGRFIDPAFERRFRRYAPEVEISFTREAVHRWQVEQWGLPTRPTKRIAKSGRPNPHAKGFEGDSVELDAVPAPQLRSMLRKTVEQHVDRHQLQVLQVAEQSEREILTRMTSRDFVDYQGWLGSVAP